MHMFFHMATVQLPSPLGNPGLDGQASMGQGQLTLASTPGKGGEQDIAITSRMGIFRRHVGLCCGGHAAPRPSRDLIGNYIAASNQRPSWRFEPLLG